MVITFVDKELFQYQIENKNEHVYRTEKATSAITAIVFNNCYARFSEFT